MSSPLESLEPRRVWAHFDAIRRIPHPSKSEEQMAEHVRAWAKSQGFEVRSDSAGNLVVKVPASPGHEKAGAVVLQGHLDMVCEKNADVVHDFAKDPIPVVVDGDWVRTRGTTLGADNGIGLATALALAEDPAAVHGPLEILCTVDEETGLTGAKMLDGSLLSGKLMLNLDTEEDGAVYIGCAGGADIYTELKLRRRQAVPASVPVRIVVRGLRGGHSGLNIVENRANAVKLVTRVLLAAIDRGIRVDLVAIEGGSKHNAIPREASATFRTTSRKLGALKKVVAKALVDFREEFGSIEPDLRVELTEIAEDATLAMVLDKASRNRLLHLLNAMPHGALAMSREVPGLVETSNNLAVVKTEADRALVVTSHRSSVMPALYAIGEQIRSLGLVCGATVDVHDAYPGWKPNPTSPLVKRTVEVYTRLFGSQPVLKAVHAGLECGLLLEKVPGMDVVSIGPEIRNPHSPDEAVQISTVGRFYQVVKALVQDLA